MIAVRMSFIFFMISAKVSIPLYRKKYTAREQEENLRIAALENRKSDAANLFYTMVEKAFTDYETAALKQQLYTRQITTTKAAIQILQTEYSSSGRNFDELLLMENELAGYDLKLLQAIVESHLAKAAIERYITF